MVKGNNACRGDTVLSRADYLRPLVRSLHANPARNWFVAEIEPCLPIASELAARAALSELQSQFYLDE